jgi:DNA replication and repair protein RecF
VTAALHPGRDPANDRVESTAPPARAAVLRLDLTRFRSYRETRLETDGRMVVLTGPNGAGKTNLLEAISFLAPGRGLRRARLVEIDHRAADGPAPWAVAARIGGPGGEVVIGTGREAQSEHADRRVVRIDGKPVKGQAALARHLNLVWLTPQMDRLFQEGASARRRFLDRLVFGFDPDHAARLAAYDQALKERARLLREGTRDPAWLGMLEETMAREGVAVAASRRDIAQRLDEAAAGGGPDRIFPVPRLRLDGTAEGWLAEMPALAAEERLRAAFEAARHVDTASGGTSVGPHRADLTVRHDGTGMAAPDCSTGEQKALLIAIVLAHARLQAALRGAAPVLLLDEVAAHLDRSRRRALYERLAMLGCQAWLTGTDPELFVELGRNAHLLSVDEGRFSTLGDHPDETNRNDDERRNDEF